MRIGDLLRPYEGGLRRILDETPAGIDVRRHLFTSDAIDYIRAGSGSVGPVPAGTIVLTALGPDRKEHGDPTYAGAVIARLEPGARAIVLFGWKPDELPYHRILDVLAEHRCQVLQVAPLELGSLGAAAVIERVDSLKEPRDPLGEPMIVEVGEGLDQLSIGLRIANESGFLACADRYLRAALVNGSRSVSEGGLDSYRTRLDSQLKERDARILQLEKQVRMYEASGALKLGRVLAAAGRSPRALVHLPLDLLRIWRSRGS